MELNEISNIFQKKIDNNESFLSKHAIKQINSKRKNKEYYTRHETNIS